MQEKRIDCLATHPGIADTRLYSKLDTAGKLEAKGLNAYKKVRPLGVSRLTSKHCVNSTCRHDLLTACKHCVNITCRHELLAVFKLLQLRLPHALFASPLCSIWLLHQFMTALCCMHGAGKQSIWGGWGHLHYQGCIRPQPDWSGVQVLGALVHPVPWCPPGHSPKQRQ